GSVAVSKSGSVYSVVFGGTLVSGNISTLTATGSAGTTATAIPNGTVVRSGAALELDGSGSAEGVTLNGVGAAELQMVSVTGSAGSYTLSFTTTAGVTKTTGSLAFDATAAQVQTALQGLSNIG